jgi:hypothetical protein
LPAILITAEPAETGTYIWIFKWYLAGVNISGGAHYTIDHEFIHGMGGIVVQLGIRRDNPVACNENTCEIVGEDPSIAIIKCILLNQYRRISIDVWWFKIWQKMRILI